jgi:hypothetical protein
MSLRRSPVPAPASPSGLAASPAPSPAREFAGQRRRWTGKGEPEPGRHDRPSRPRPRRPKARESAAPPAIARLWPTLRGSRLCRRRITGEHKLPPGGSNFRKTKLRCPLESTKGRKKEAKTNLNEPRVRDRSVSEISLLKPTNKGRSRSSNQDSINEERSRETNGTRDRTGFPRRISRTEFRFSSFGILN